MYEVVCSNTTERVQNFVNRVKEKYFCNDAASFYLSSPYKIFLYCSLSLVPN